MNGGGTVYINSVALFAQPSETKPPLCVASHKTLCVYGKALRVEPDSMLPARWEKVAPDARDRSGVTLLLQVCLPKPFALKLFESNFPFFPQSE